jgi:hypothetical protein
MVLRKIQLAAPSEVAGRKFVTLSRITHILKVDTGFELRNGLNDLQLTIPVASTGTDADWADAERYAVEVSHRISNWHRVGSGLACAVSIARNCGCLTENHRDWAVIKEALIAARKHAGCPECSGHGCAGTQAEKK